MIFRFRRKRAAISGALANAPLTERAENRQFRALCGVEFRAILDDQMGIFRVRPAHKPESGSNFRRDWFERLISARARPVATGWLAGESEADLSTLQGDGLAAQEQGTQTPGKGEPTGRPPAINPRFSYRGEDIVATLERICRSVGYTFSN